MGVDPLLRDDGSVLLPDDCIFFLGAGLPHGVGGGRAFFELELLEFCASLARGDNGWAGDKWAGCSDAMVGSVWMARTVWPLIKMLEEE